jgi:cell division protein FtsW
LETALLEETRKIDRVLFVSVILLVGFGVVMIYSASAVRAAAEMNDGMFFMTRQATFAALGVVAMLVASQINYHFYQKLIYPMLVFSILGLVLVHSPVGITRNGAARWIGVGGLSVQPAEIMKIVLVLWLSYSLAKKSDKIKSFSIGFLPHLLVPGFIIVLCLAQPDFGTSVVLALVTFCLLFVAGAKLSYMMLACITVAPIIYYLVAGSEYRLKRILTFLDPISSRFADGYQLTQSLFGFGAGGLFGAGIGDGLQKFFFLPEPQNDFIASIIAEELGVVGIWTVMFVFAVLVSRGVVIAYRARDELGMYIASGLSMLLGIQALVNLGVAMGLLPTKGLTLPFISYGGSSLVISFFSVGILLNISKRPELKPLAEKTKKRPMAAGLADTMEIAE